MRQRFAGLSFCQPTVSLRRLVLRGTVWTLVGYGIAQLLRLAGNLILTRLLYPELFGLMALVNTFLVGLALLSDLGLGWSIVQNPRGSERAFLDTVWTIQVARGVSLWGLSIVLAGLFAQFYGEAELGSIIPVASFSVLLSGFNATSLFTLKRELKLGTLTRLELVSQASGLAVILVWAWFAPSVWALVAGGLGSALVKLALSHSVSTGRRNRLAWDRTAAQAIWSFGKWILISSAITFFAEQSDRLTLGKVVPLEVLGVYGIALAFAEIPRQMTTAVAGNVLFPAFSSLRELTHFQLREKISKNRMRALYLLAVGLALLVGSGDLLIYSLYDARYWQAAWMLPVLALGLWPRLLCNTIEPVLFALGKPQYSTIAQVGRVLWTIGGVLIGFTWAGIVGALIAISLNDLVYYFVISTGLRREGLLELRSDVQSTMVLLSLAATVISVRFVLGWGWLAYG